MKKIAFFLLLFSFSILGAYCQQVVTISGKLKMKPGSTLRFTKYLDYISLDKERLATVKTGNDSCFHVAFSLKAPEIIGISVNELALEGLFYPTLNYSLELTSTGNDHTGNLIITACNQPINPQIVLKNTYNIFSDSTLSILFNQNNQRPSKKSVDLFNSVIDAALLHTNDTFCKQMIQSLRVEYLTMSRAVTFRSAFERYFDCANLPMRNPAFQSLISSGFRLYFNSGPHSITRQNIFQKTTDSLHFTNILRMMSVDSALNCLPIRETVLLGNLFAMIKSGEINRAIGINILKEATVSAFHPFNRQVANNLINSIIRQESGTTIPDFPLIFPDKSIHSLSSFTGKPLHITFFNLKGVADQTLLSQLSDVEHLADSLGIAHFICITTDTNQETVQKYWETKKLPMQLCFAPDDYELVDYFNAYTTPCFILLDSKGKINTLAPNFPGEQLLKQLISLHQKDTSKP